MTPDAVVAYVPVLHEGYRRFLDAHGRDRPLHLIDPALHGDFRPLAKDVRALAPDVVAPAIAAWGLCSDVRVLDEAGARALAESGASLILPDEDVSHQVVERWFPRTEVAYASAFLRWDKTKTVRLLDVGDVRAVDADAAYADLAGAAEAAAARSIDWWRQVGAAIRFAGGDGEVWSASNAHLPHPQAPYAVGDPRSNFFQGVHLELSTAVHAEAALIARAAREGRSTEGAVMYVTDFPCPPCAKLIAGAGISRLIFRTGYAVLDGRDVLEGADVELLQLTP